MPYKSVFCNLMKVSEDIKSVLQNLSARPGLSLYDAKEALLYIGKAKNLKAECFYFNRKHDSFKTTYMVRKIQRIETLIIDTEMDALLLENNLIKNKPRYNILLKDDKTYPGCIKKPFPRVFYTRKLIKDSSEYSGPMLIKNH